MTSLETPKAHAAAHRAYYDKTYGRWMKGATKEQRTEITKPLHEWYRTNQTAFIDHEFAEGRAKKWMMEGIDALQGVVSVVFFLTGNL